MDYVDNDRGAFSDLSVLDLSETDCAILEIFADRFRGHKVRFLIIHRGLSSAAKVVLKPESFFPLLIKLDSQSRIEMEHDGDALLRYRVPPISIPPLEGVIYKSGRGGIAYRYVTGGRVKHPIRRFDTALHELPLPMALRVIDDIFDVILKKCHWLDGGYTMRKISLPEMPADSEHDQDQQWSHMQEMYALVREVAQEIVAPHGIIHGDLHSKNVLITRDDAPVLIDFSMAKQDACHYIDFAKFESTLPFQVDGSLGDTFWKYEKLLYGPTSLIIPHSNSKLAACVQRIRANLWQGCTRMSLQMDSQQIELGYRAHLIYCLIRFYSRLKNTSDNRQRAYHQVCGLAESF